MTDAEDVADYLDDALDYYAKYGHATETDLTLGEHLVDVIDADSVELPSAEHVAAALDMAAQLESQTHLLTPGQVHAMRAEVDQGRPLFEASRKLDPKFYDASIGEGVMLSDARQIGDSAHLDWSHRPTGAGGRRERSTSLR